MLLQGTVVSSASRQLRTCAGVADSALCQLFCPRCEAGLVAALLQATPSVVSQLASAVFVGGCPPPLCPLIRAHTHTPTPQVNVLVSGLGGLSPAAAALAGFRSRAAAAGFPCVHIMVMGYGARSLPAPIPGAEAIGAIAFLPLAWPLTKPL